MRSFAVEGTVYWLIISAVSTFLLSLFEPQTILIAFAFSVIFIVVAYFSWIQKAWSFIAAIILALVVIVSDISYPIFLNTGTEITPLQYPGEELIIIIQLLIIVFSLRAYKELKQVKSKGRKK